MCQPKKAYYDCQKRHAVINNMEWTRPEKASYNPTESLGPKEACCYKLIPVVTSTGMRLFRIFPEFRIF